MALVGNHLVEIGLHIRRFATKPGQPRHASTKCDTRQVPLFSQRSAFLVQAAPDPSAAYSRINHHLITI